MGALVIVVLSVDNRGMVELVFWPLPFNYQMPLYAVFLIGLFAGRAAGRHGHLAVEPPSRREARALRRKVRAVEYQERLKREREEQEALEQARRKTQNLALSRAAGMMVDQLDGRDAHRCAGGRGGRPAWAQRAAAGEIEVVAKDVRFPEGPLWADGALYFRRVWRPHHPAARRGRRV